MKSSELPTPARLGISDVIRLGLHSMNTRPLRATLSAVGVAIGIAAMVAVIGIPASANQALNDQLAQLGTNLLRAAPGQDFTGKNTVLPVDSVDLVRRINPVISASAIGNTQATVRRSDQIPSEITSGLSVFASRLDLPEVIGAQLYRGVFLNAATEHYPAAVLGAVAAERLGVDTIDPIQPPRVWIDNSWFTVVGILRPLSLTQDVDQSVLIGWDAAQHYLGFTGHPDTVYVRAVDSQVENVRAVLSRTLNPENPNAVLVSKPSDALIARRLSESNYSALLLGLGAIALLVGGVGVANTMIISVVERRREIGLRRALGSTRGQIRVQFLTESVLLSGFGGGVGALIGVVIIAGYAGAQKWPPIISPVALLGGIGAAALVGAIAGLYPAIRASLLTPTEALA